MELLVEVIKTQGVVGGITVFFVYWSMKVSAASKIRFRLSLSSLLSARGIKARIRKLVDDENARRPLTDQAIVDILKKEGVQIARRTVAKYRDQLGILSARMRKRV